MNQHIIYRQHIILKTENEMLSQTVQNAVSEVMKNELPDVLQTVFDELSTEDEIIRIDSLQLDLGTLSPEDIQHSFAANIAQQIREIIIQKKQSREEENGVVIIRNQQSLREGFLYFLQTGLKPWFDTKKNRDDWQTQMQHAFQQQDWQKIIYWLKENDQQQPVVLERLVNQFSDDFLGPLILLIAPFIQQEWKEMYADLMTVFNSIIPRQETKNRNEIWLSLLAAFIKKSYNPEVLYTIIKRKIAQPGNHAISSFLSVISYHQLQSLLVCKAIERLANEEKKNSESTEIKAFDTAMVNSTGKETEATNKQSLIHPEETLTETNKVVTVEPFSLIKIPVSKKLPGEIIGKEPQYVSNSGIILLHPFLELYFDDLALLTNKKFIDTEACQRAVLLLHYLATGETEMAEYNGLLQKIICGLSIEETLPDLLELSDKEKEESEKLLQSVINYWPPMKNTSIEGLRSTFLQRDGKLEKKENGWLLSVEQKTVDVLLDKLPWGFSTIRLPWMKEIISVDWC